MVGSWSQRRSQIQRVGHNNSFDIYLCYSLKHEQHNHNHTCNSLGDLLFDPAGQRLPSRGSRGISSMKDMLMYATIFAYLVIAAALTYVVAPDTFNRAVWHVIEFFQTVNHVVNILALPA